MAERTAAEAELLSVISDLSFARELSRVTEIVRSAARRLTGADGVTFVLKQEGECFYADEDAIAPLWKGRRFPLRSCISGWVMEHRVAAAIRDIYADDRIPHDAYRPTFVRSLLMVPVREEDPIAAIGAYWAHEHEATAEEQAVLEALARASSLALLNVSLWSDLERSLAREQSARQAAEQANAIKDEFLAVVSHELRTPLNVMQGCLWQLQQPDVTPERLTKTVAMLSRNTALQTRLVEDLLDVSRAVAGKLKLEPRLLDLGSVAEVVVDVVRPEADRKNVHLSFHADGQAPLILGDPDRIQQILWNLLSNAIKFTPGGGSVEVAVGRRESRALLTVQDTGIGMSAEFLPHMFDRFRQADGGTTRQHGGLGVGLAIVQELVTLHGGTVSAASAGTGAGTTVRVELPIPALLSEPGTWLKRRARSEPRDPVTLAGISVLVLDDEPEACEALRQILEQHEAEVHVATSAEEALALLQRVTPRLVLSDLAMPGTDGFAFLRALRDGSSAARNVPAVALSALAASDYGQQARAAGFQLFLQKPIPPDDLALRLARLATESPQPGH